MEILTNIPVELDPEALMKTAHVEPGSRDAADFEALVGKAREIAHPKALFRECYVEARGKGTVTIDGVTFTSNALRTNLDKVERVFPYVATCGRELDQIAFDREDFLKQFWFDTIKATVLGIGIHHLNEYVDGRYALTKTVTMNPGSGDVTVWPIEQQRKLFALLGDVDELIGVELTDSCLMVPNKSVSGIRFPTESDFKSCQLCHREKCSSRAAPFDQELWESIGPGGTITQHENTVGGEPDIRQGPGQPAHR